MDNASALARLVAAVEDAKDLYNRMRANTERLIDARNDLEAQAALEAGGPQPNCSEMHCADPAVVWYCAGHDLRARLAAEHERVALAEGAVEQLQTALAAVEAERDAATLQHGQYRKETLRVHQHNVALAAALARYGAHDDDCDYRILDKPCTCGFDAALKK